MNTKLVVCCSVALLAAGTAFICGLEWSNPKTLGALATVDTLLAGFFQSVMTRTAGFNSLAFGQMVPATWLGVDVLMFIGGGPGAQRAEDLHVRRDHRGRGDSRRGRLRRAALAVSSLGIFSAGGARQTGRLPAHCRAGRCPRRPTGLPAAPDANTGRRPVR